MRRLFMATPMVIGAVLVGALANPGKTEAPFTTDFRLEECPRFASTARNPYFPLIPGRVWHYEGDRDGEFVQLEISVLDEVQPITFEVGGRAVTALTRVVEERETIDGELYEVSRNYFARCWDSHDLYYFGEAVDFYEDGRIVGHDGSWQAGEDGATPGLLMPATFLLGSRYFQEVAPGIAEDRAENLEMGLAVDVPAGRFENCVYVLETTPLEPGAENFKIYAPGVGMVVSDELELVEFRP